MQSIQFTTLEDELQKWIDKQDDQGVDVFKMLDFDFTPIVTILIGEKIRDTSKNQLLEKDWSQFPSSLQGTLDASLSPSQGVSLVDKGSTTPLPMVNEEQVQSIGMSNV